MTKTLHGSILFLTCALILMFSGCDNGKVNNTAITPSETSLKRADHTAGKGMELYSWKPKGEDWHFSLVHGTNRMKSLEEITDQKNVIIGIENLKHALSVLAVGEDIVWCKGGALSKEDRSALQKMTSKQVDEGMVKEIESYCKKLDMKLIRY